MKLIKLLATILLFTTSYAFPPTLQQMKDSLPSYVEIVKNTDLSLGTGGNQDIPYFIFSRIYSLISNIYPNAGNDRHATTSAILSNVYSSIECDQIWQSEETMNNSLYLLLALHRYYWLNIVNSTPNNKNQSIEAAANLISIRLFSFWCCTYLFNNNNNNTPFVDGANDSFSFYKNSSNNLISIDLNDVFTNVNFSELYTAFGCTASGCHGTISGGNGQYYYTPNSGFVGIDTLQYSYSLGGNPVAMDEPYYYIYINVIDTSTTYQSLFYSEPLIDICVDSSNYRINWTFNYNTLGVSNFFLENAYVIISSDSSYTDASTFNITNNTNGYITGYTSPRIGTQSHLNIEDCYLVFRVQYYFNGILKYYDIWYLLPRIDDDYNGCISNIHVVGITEVSPE